MSNLSRTEYNMRRAARAESGTGLARIVSTAPRTVHEVVKVTPKCITCGMAATETVTLTAGWTRSMLCCPSHAAAWAAMAARDGYLCKREAVQA